MRGARALVVGLLIAPGACGGEAGGPTEDTAPSGDPGGMDTDAGGSTGDGGTAGATTTGTGDPGSTGSTGTPGTTGGSTGAGETEGTSTGGSTGGESTGGGGSTGGAGSTGAGSTGGLTGECNGEIFCPEGGYCVYPDNMCGKGAEYGTCYQAPKICTKEFNPVCACDGLTYDNPCVAKSAGLDILHEGEC